MNITLRSTVVMATLASALFSGSASAGDTYIGLSRTTPGEASVTFPNAAPVKNYNNPVAVKLYGGMALNDRYGIEIGYGAFGTWKAVNPTPGSTETFNMSFKLLYVAGKASKPLGESFSLFGKFGLAANKFSTQHSSQASESNTFVRPMLGFGVDYKISEHISGVLEYNYYGKSGGLTQQKLELGLKYKF